jgi:hypothetical protein
MGIVGCVGTLGSLGLLDPKWLSLLCFLFINTLLVLGIKVRNTLLYSIYTILYVLYVLYVYVAVTAVLPVHKHPPSAGH